MAELLCGREPYVGMNILGHDHEADTTSFVCPQFTVEHTQQDPFRVVVVEKPTTSKHGEGNEMGIQPVIDDLSMGAHDTILSARLVAHNLLGLRPTGSRTGATRGHR